MSKVGEKFCYPPKRNKLQIEEKLNPYALSEVRHQKVGVLLHLDAMHVGVDAGITQEDNDLSEWDRKQKNNFPVALNQVPKNAIIWRGWQP